MTDFELQVLAELRRLCELIERRDLLRAIHNAAPDAEFTTTELVRHAALPANGDLRAAIERGFTDPNPRRIGKFLASIAGQEIGGFIVEAIGEERDGVIWRVASCLTKPTLPVARHDDDEHAADSIR